MSTKQQKDTAKRNSLRVEIDADVDMALEKHIAGTKVTKRAFVEQLLRKALKLAA